MRILHELCSVPTAPFAERYVIEYVERFARQRRKLKLSRDRWGNLLLTLPGSGKPSAPRWVFAAHMDHPGLVAGRGIDSRTLEADFRGGVAAEYVAGARVRFFEPGRETTGVIAEILDSEPGGRWTTPRRVRVRLARARAPGGDRQTTPGGGLPAPGTPGMFDQGAARVKGERFYSRVCDDLAGAAAALAMLDRLHRRPPRNTVCVLLTRAEEDGFIGAIAAATRPQLLRRSDRIIAIECSAEQPVARQGEGCIIRTGDRTSIFNSGLTYFLTQQAESLAKKDPTFRYQRALMPGGTCEATVYDVEGFTAASLCVALGNYHNMDLARQRIAPEHVHLADWRNMVRLFIHLARSGHEFAPGHAALKARLRKRFQSLRHLLAPAAAGMHR